MNQWLFEHCMVVCVLLIGCGAFLGSLYMYLLLYFIYVTTEEED